MTCTFGGQERASFAKDYESLYRKLEAKNQADIEAPLLRQLAQWRAVCEAQKEDIAELRESNEALIVLLDSIKTPVEFWASCNTDKQPAYKALLTLIDIQLEKVRMK